MQRYKGKNTDKELVLRIDNGCLEFSIETSPFHSHTILLEKSELIDLKHYIEKLLFENILLKKY
jgi:hypothetical protein